MAHLTIASKRYCVCVCVCLCLCVCVYQKLIEVIDFTQSCSRDISGYVSFLLFTQRSSSSFFPNFFLFFSLVAVFYSHQVFTVRSFLATVSDENESRNGRDNCSTVCDSVSLSLSLCVCNEKIQGSSFPFFF